jgi:hypothetical protein
VIKEGKINFEGKSFLIFIKFKARCLYLINQSI